LQTSFNAVDFDAWRSSVVFAPEGGFPADAGSLPSFGINPTAADSNVPGFLSNLISDLQALTTFLNANPLATLTSAQQTQYQQLQATLTSQVAQLSTLNPSAYGIAANADAEDKLFSLVLPQYYQALTNATILYMTANGFTASLHPPKRMLEPWGRRDGRLLMAEWYPGEGGLINASLTGALHPKGIGHFQFGGVIEVELVCEIQMDLIKQIYVPYIVSVAKAMATVALAKAFQGWLGGQNLEAIITGADQEIQIFNAAPSALEGDNFNSDPDLNLVYLIGPDQVNGVTDIVSNVTTWVNNLVKNPPKDLNGANKALQSFKDFYNKQVAFANCLYNESLQAPDSTFNSCIFGVSSSCTELVFNNGLSTVYNPSGPALPSPVIFITWNVPAGAFSVGTYYFIPLASPTPPGACHP